MSSHERLLRLALDRAEILGLVLSGSRGRGTAHATSDWDCYLILAEGSDVDVEVRSLSDESLDLTVMSLSEYRVYATPGTECAWDAYAFAHVLIEHDGLGGEIAAIAAGKELLDEDESRALAGEALDAYINAAVRSAKSRREDRRASAVLDAAEGVAPALQTLFSLDRRIRPFNRYLGWELARHPLVTLAGPVDLERLIADVLHGEVEAAASLFALVEAGARKADLGTVLDAWGREALTMVRGYARGSSSGS